MIEEKNNYKHIISSAMLVSGIITLVIFVISIVAEIFLLDPTLLILDHGIIPTEASIKMLSFILLISFIFIYIPLKLGVHTQPISRKSGILILILLTYLLSSVSVAVFLSLVTETIDYSSLSEENPHTKILLENGIPCTFDHKESLFDIVSGFTTTGLTAFKRTGVFIDGEEVSKIDAQPMIVHIIRVTYLWISGLGIIFFFLYFTPISSLIMGVGYEIPSEKSHPVSIQQESLSILLLYASITLIGILLLFFCISVAYQPSISDTYQFGRTDDGTLLAYSIVLTFSSISTGGFSPSSVPVDQMEVEGCPIINNWGLLVIMGLMLAGAMPIFSLHRSWKFFKWQIFVAFLLPIAVIAAASYSENCLEVSLYRSFDAISAFTTTGLCTSQLEKDSIAIGKSQDDFQNLEPERWTIKEFYWYRLQKIYLIGLMFIGGAAYSTAGGWGFFNVFCIARYIRYKIRRKKFRGILKFHLSGIMLSFIVFFSIFVIGTLLCYKSGFPGAFSDPEPATVADHIINSAFYEISALSTVGLMPESMLQNAGIYYNDSAYWTLTISMLIGRLYRILFPILVLSSGEVGTLWQMFF